MNRINKNIKEIGFVSSIHGRELSIFFEDRIIKATVKGKLLEGSSKHNIVSGDYCTIEKNKNRFLVTGKLKRETELIRFLEKKDRMVKNQVIAANCNQLLAVFSFTEPNINPFFLDLILCHAQYTGIYPIIVINKIDIICINDYQNLIDSYKNAGFEMLFISVKKTINIDKIRHLLKDNKTVLLGPSGSGKSSLLKAINPEISLKIGSLTKQKKGRHTTTSSIVYKIFDNSYIYDTPGFGKLYHSNIDHDIVSVGYPEFFRSDIICEYRNCRHIEEKNCRIKDELLKDKICKERYKRYYILSNNKDPVYSDLKKDIPDDTGLFISKRSTFKVFDIDEALKYKKYLKDIQGMNWFYYAPFLYFQGLSINRRVLLKEINGKIQIFLWRLKDNIENISLFFINPLTKPDEIYDLIKFLKDINESNNSIISFLSEKDMEILSHRNDIEIELIGREYIYSREEVVHMKGGSYRDLRKKIYRFERSYPIILRKFQIGDSLALQNLYTRWLSFQSTKYMELYDSYYTENVLKKLDDLLRLDIDILIAEVENKVIGFIMGSKMNDRCSNAFIMKTDNTYDGLSYYLKYKYIQSRNTDFINDGIDFGYFGIRQAKRVFNPYMFPRVYRARIRGQAD